VSGFRDGPPPAQETTKQTLSSMPPANTGLLRAERWYLQQLAVVELYAVSRGLLRLHI
jgi:hypothetical protein